MMKTSAAAPRPRPLDAAAVWQALLARRYGRPDGAALAGTAIEPEAAALIELYGPLAAVPRPRPFAVAHLAQSLDGRIATIGGASRWLSGEADLMHTHRMRALADAVVVGAGTVLHDDPQLTVRRCSGAHPVRVVIDPERRLEARHRVFCDGLAPTLLLAAADRIRPGERLGEAEIVPIPRSQDGLAPQEIRRSLAERGLAFLFVEGGGVTISRFLAARALDRLQLTLAPLLLGSGRPSLTLPEIADPSHGLRPRIRRAALGEDLMYECIFDD
jgi:diaminohydroxyphosphoribosylaminopyrimidine deaminase / 5-amino-6-(5-phosphoribosylamino)uracil reductase